MTGCSNSPYDIEEKGTLKSPKGNSKHTEAAWVQCNIWYHAANTGVDNVDTI